MFFLRSRILHKRSNVYILPIIDFDTVSNPVIDKNEGQYAGLRSKLEAQTNPIFHGLK